ncbi:MAG TPA: 4-hydroxythreonine-4-phosphate dehydrogenase PdxA [Burkholderiaceae bacterium]|nr:4-hydroxythreonine-4-phosphate dehydrogenase PdxA [Burkholderiaceae bacterium]
MPPTVSAQESPNQMPIGITMGDAAGIGPEIIVRMFAGGLPHPAVVIGDADTLRQAAAQLTAARHLTVSELTTAAEALNLPASTIGVINPWESLTDTIAPGQVSAHAGRAAYEYLCRAIDDATAGHLRAIVTAPLHKEALQQAGVPHPGHTEILAERSHSKQVAMLMVNEELRVILGTIHIALAKVPAALSIEQQLTMIHLAHQACQQAGIAQPRIAVAGLNPHAGEAGQFGTEEQDIIIPAIEQARTEGLDVSGPWPGDTVFMQARQGRFDIVLAQYHDQGLIPIKYLGVDDGVNMTVGLPFVRTSVDHGTAFDIAGQGVASEASLRKAFELAVAMSAGSASDDSEKAMRLARRSEGL